MADKQPSKADALRAMREAKYAAKSSDGGGESRPAVKIASGQFEASACPVVKSAAVQAQKSERGRGIGSGAEVKRSSGQQAGVAPSPSEAIPAPTKKRAPRGTFDRNAYQREYMRKRRQKEAKSE